MGPTPALKHSTDGLAWAQNCHQTMLPMSLHGPSSVPKYFCQWSRMGPALAPNYATDELAWAQDCHQTMLPITLHGPRTVPKLCYRCSQCLAVMLFYATNNLFWAQHMPRNLLQIIWDHYCPKCVCCAAPNVLLIVLHGPSHYHKLCCPVTCMGLDLR